MPAVSPRIVPVSAILPTRNRAPILARFLESLAAQDTLPSEIVICDASEDDCTHELVKSSILLWQKRFGVDVIWRYIAANRAGLAPQRNQAVAAATQKFVWFLDDDIILEPGCLARLYEILDGDEGVGGVTATLINEPYHPPGRATRALMRWFENGYERESYASACVGPGWTFLHDAATDGPPLMRAEWLGGGCSVYRKCALSEPAVPDHFEGGAIGEDLAASLHVGKHWRMWHVRAARAIHDSQGGSHKRSRRRMAEQGLLNRYYILTRIMGRDAIRDHVDFAVMNVFTLVSLLRQPRDWKFLIPNMLGISLGLWKICSPKYHF
jgi:glycosyltransferase involved in cell wall biosynthesis